MNATQQITPPRVASLEALSLAERIAWRNLKIASERGDRRARAQASRRYAEAAGLVATARLESAYVADSASVVAECEHG